MTSWDDPVVIAGLAAGVVLLPLFVLVERRGRAPMLDLAIFRDPVTLSPNILGWIAMFAPLIMVFAFGAAINRLSAAGAQLFF